MLRTVLLLAVLIAVAVASSEAIFRAFERDPVKGCWDCKYERKGGACCKKGQMCPGNVPCCATCPSGACACTTTCTPKCGTDQCGNGGCPMLPDTACGKCGNGTVCESGQCVPPPKCNYCDMNPSGGCCFPGELCPGNVPCCGTKRYVNYACTNKCTPRCGNSTCGDGGCPLLPNACGKCTEDNYCGATQPNAVSPTFQCQCREGCHCGGACGKKCPAESTGCRLGGCACLGPRNNAKTVTVRPSKFLLQTTNMFAGGCSGNVGPCGGFTLIGPDTPQPYQIGFVGEKGFAGETELWAFFELDAPLEGERVFIEFAPNNTATQRCMPGNQYPPMYVTMTNCSKTDYKNCSSNVGNRCMKEEDPKGCGQIEMGVHPGQRLGRVGGEPQDEDVHDPHRCPELGRGMRQLEPHSDLQRRRHHHRYFVLSELRYRVSLDERHFPPLFWGATTHWWILLMFSTACCCLRFRLYLQMSFCEPLSVYGHSLLSTPIFFEELRKALSLVGFGRRFPPSERVSLLGERFISSGGRKLCS